jgi:hypothetical protein
MRKGRNKPPLLLLETHAWHGIFVCLRIFFLFHHHCIFCLLEEFLKTKSKKKFNFLFACLNQRVQDSLLPPACHSSSSSSSTTSSSHGSFMSVTQQTTTDNTAPRPSLALRPIILAQARPSLRVLGYMQEEARRARDSSPRAGRGQNPRHWP